LIKKLILIFFLI